MHKTVQFYLDPFTQEQLALAEGLCPVLPMPRMVKAPCQPHRKQSQTQVLHPGAPQFVYLLHQAASTAAIHVACLLQFKF